MAVSAMVDFRVEFIELLFISAFVKLVFLLLFLLILCCRWQILASARCVEGRGT